MTMPTKPPTLKHTVPIRQKQRNPISNTIHQSHAWKQLSREMRQKFPFCADPFVKHGLPVPATSVHHRLRVSSHPGRAYDRDNLICLCDECHRLLDKLETTNEREHDHDHET